MEKKVYVVELLWDSGDDCPDNWYNCSENEVVGVFSAKALANDYIAKEIIRTVDKERDNIVYCNIDHLGWDWLDYDKFLIAVNAHRSIWFHIRGDFGATGHSYYMHEMTLDAPEEVEI